MGKLYLGKMLIKQALITSSTMEVEFVACYEVSNHGIWLRNFVIGPRIMEVVERPLKIYCDNKSAMLYSNNNRSSFKSKYIDIEFLGVKERVHNGQISIKLFRTDAMIAVCVQRCYHPKSFISVLLI